MLYHFGIGCHNIDNNDNANSLNPQFNREMGDGKRVKKLIKWIAKNYKTYIKKQ